MKSVKSLTITLNKGDSQEKRIVMPKHTASIVWDAMELSKKVYAGFDSKKEMEEAVMQVCGWYDDLTFDELMSGLDSRELISFLIDSCDFLTQGTIGRFDDLKNVAVRETTAVTAKK